MIKTEIKVFDNFPKITAEVKRRTQRGLDDAASAGRAVALARGAGVSDFAVVATHGTATGFASGIRGNLLVRIFDKGSLGKRRGALKQPGRRKESWPVTRRDRTHTADRGNVAGKGISPRNILSPARTAGRKALISALRR